MTRRLAARFDAARGDARLSSDIAAYAARLPQDAGTVLVAGTRQARVLVELLRLGYTAHGLEASPDAFDDAQHALRDGGFDVPFFRQDIDGVNLPFRYAGVVIDPRISQRMERLALELALQRMRAHLIGPCIVLLPIEIPREADHPPGAPIVEIERVKVEDGAVITRRRERVVESDAQRMRITDRYELRAGAAVARREDDHVSIEWYDADAALALVRDAGFDSAAVDALASFDDAQRYVVIGSVKS